MTDDDLRSTSPAQKSRQHIDGIHPDRFDGVAALHDEKGRLFELGDLRAIVGEIIRFELEETDRVLLERIDAERYDDCVGAEAVDLPEGVRERLRPLVVERSGSHRIVHIEALALAAALLVLVAEEI